MMVKRQLIVLLSVSILSINALAEVDNLDSEGKPLTQAEQWLELQRQGSQASLNKQHLSGPVMENIHKRYLESFTRPIPERFDPGQFSRQ
ncbi:MULTISPECIES: DUF3613 domain-containing protein [Methylobacillus]|nr:MULTISPECIES: DUF3613 domain-containing protein [Methylobacillus]